MIILFKQNKSSTSNYMDVNHNNYNNHATEYIGVNQNKRVFSKMVRYIRDVRQSNIDNFGVIKDIIHGFNVEDEFNIQIWSHCKSKKRFRL